LQLVTPISEDSEIKIDYGDHTNIYVLAINRGDDQGMLSFEITGYPYPAFGTKEIIFIVLGGVLGLIFVA
jgi:hypothetical protein